MSRPRRSVLAAALLLLAAAVVALVLALRPSPATPPSAPTPALRSLRLDHYDPHHGLRYWTHQLDNASDEWQEAMAFCADAPAERYPNCATVRLLDTASRIPGFLPPKETQTHD